MHTINNSSGRINILIISLKQGNYKADRAVRSPARLIGTRDIGFAPLTNLHEIPISATNSRADLISRARASEEKYSYRWCENARRWMGRQADSFIGPQIDDGLRSSGRTFLPIFFFLSFHSIYLPLNLWSHLWKFITMPFSIFSLINDYFSFWLFLYAKFAWYVPPFNIIY